MSMSKGERAVGFRIFRQCLVVEMHVLLKIFNGFRVTGMCVQIKCTVNTGKFCEGNPLKKLFPVHLLARTGGTHRPAWRSSLRLITGWWCRSGLRLVTGRHRPGLRLVTGRHRSGLRLVTRWHRSGLRLVAGWWTRSRLRLNTGILTSSLVAGISSLELSKRSVIHHLHAPRFPRNGLSSSGKIVPACIALSN